MAKRKSSSSIPLSSKTAKRQVSLETFKKWQRTYEKDYRSLSWLRCDTDNDSKLHVSILWCLLCRKYENKIAGHKNFSKSWIDGSLNHKTSNISDHAKSEQHKSAMMLFNQDEARSRNEPITTYSPIARGILSIDPVVKERVMKKFDIAYLIAKEHVPFVKYPAIHELEERHGVDLGSTYRNRDSA
jgi:hypothetical protein